ncbi:MAG: VRR-NUC domain-containing protein, partial [Pseudomonadales bacterium]|nr:VRR-NUC domain-containing protein [Pseudomonadales bacterium]
KGPGDKLQKNQTRWFEFFRQENIPASVANVEYSS